VAALADICIWVPKLVFGTHRHAAAIVEDGPARRTAQALVEGRAGTSRAIWVAVKTGRYGGACKCIFGAGGGRKACAIEGKLIRVGTSKTGSGGA